MQPPEARKGNGLLRTGAEAGQACEMQPDGETLNEPDGIGPQSSRQGRLRQTHENFVNFEELLKRISCFQVVLHLLDSPRSEEHTSELQSLMRISYAVFCLKKKTHTTYDPTNKLITRQK